ncbi:DUF5671 domain-containing protein [Patescibacteria group bacterium]
MNGQDILLTAFPFIAMVAVIGGVALLIGSAQDSKGQKSKTDGIRHVYMYLVSFVTLLIVAASIISLIAIGMQAWVFTDASAIGYQSPPPTVYLEHMNEPASAAETDICTTDKCQLTTEQRQGIDSWKQEYVNWQENSDTNRARAQSIVTALSFLVIAGIVFFFHWRLAQRDRLRDDGSPLMVRAIYLWSLSFIWLLTLIISGGFLVNTVLKQAIPSAREVATNIEALPVTERQGVTQLEECAEICQLDSEIVTLANQWPSDYAQWRKGERRGSPFANNMVATIPFVIVSSPLFWYHFRKVRRESKDHQASAEKKEE